MTEKNQADAAGAAEGAADVAEKGRAGWLYHPAATWTPRCFLGLAATATGAAMFTDGSEATDAYLLSSALCYPALTVALLRVIWGGAGLAKPHTRAIPHPAALAALLLITFNLICTFLIVA